MPFTPFHLGPGALVKAIAPRAFSFQVFALSQILIDIQPGLGLLLGWGELHGWTHTWPGALAIALATLAAWHLWTRLRPPRLTIPVSLPVAIGSALFGTLSHVWLDSQFHAEMHALTPTTLQLWQTGDVTTQIENACLAAAGLALLIAALRRLALSLVKHHRPTAG